jgi:CDP-6-deoxy-D-xylo-4-hexulose-3-dehydrase
MKKVFYGKAVYNSKEINAVTSVLKNTPLTLIDGPKVKELEKKIAKVFGKKYGVMVNSGSSANLLALTSLNFKPGSEVITPILTFSTTVAPMYQLNLMPHFIDVEKNKFIADINQIEKCVNKKTKAIMIPNLLGNIPDWIKIQKIAKKYKLNIIEDSADTIGYSINGKTTGNISDVVTCSFYASHIITGAGFGGIVCFNDKKLYQRALLFRGWGRSSALFGESESLNARFNNKLNGMKYDSKYIFSEMGYNFLPSELSAAFALEQLKKLKNNIKIREYNFNLFYQLIHKNLSDYFDLPEQQKNVKTGWLAFPLLVKKNKFFDRNNLQIYLEKKNIQTRTIFTGNILKQPVMKNRKYKKLKNVGQISDLIMKNGILLGCHHGMKKNEILYMYKCISEFIRKKTKYNYQ